METCICQFYTSTKSRIALQVARKIAPCDRALTGIAHIKVRHFRAKVTFLSHASLTSELVSLLFMPFCDSERNHYSVNSAMHLSYDRPCRHT